VSRRLQSRSPESYAVYEIPILILVLLLVAILLRLDIIFYLVYVVVGIYAFSRWWTGRGLRSVHVQRSFAEHAFLGERIAVQLTLGNRAVLPIPWLRINEAVPLALHTPGFVRRVTSLGPRERTHITYDLNCRRRGYYPIGPLEASSGDLFGFAESQGYPAGVDYLTVYPEIIPLSHLGFPSRSPFGTIKSQQRIFEDPARVTGVRDYRAGDSLRRVHWKASAREGSLQVKKYQPAISLQTVILLNLNRSEYSPKRSFDAPERAIVVAASIANHMVNQRQAVGLVTNGSEITPLNAANDDARAAPTPLPAKPGRLHLMKVLEVLARVQPQDTEPSNAWFQQASLPLSWGDTVVAVTPIGDEPACQALHQLCRRGLNVVLVVVERHGPFGPIRERARRLGFRAFEVSRREDMNLWR